MLNQNVTSLSIIRDRVPNDVFQLITIEGDYNDQVLGLIEIGKRILKNFPDVNLHISSNPHDVGTYAGLEIEEDSLMKYPHIENNVFGIAESLGYEF